MGEFGTFAWTYCKLVKGVMVDEKGYRVLSEPIIFKSVEEAEAYIEEHDLRITLIG